LSWVADIGYAHEAAFDTAVTRFLEKILEISMVARNIDIFRALISMK